MMNDRIMIKNMLGDNKQVVVKMFVNFVIYKMFVIFWWVKGFSGERLNRFKGLSFFLI